MNWPWRRFERMFQQHLIRKGVESMTRQRDLMVAAINANSAWDTKEAQEGKQERIASLYESHRQGVEIAYGSRKMVEKASDPLVDDPLFAPFRAMGSGVAQQAQSPKPEQAGMGRAILQGTT